VADILTGTICGLELEFPKLTAERKKRLEMAQVQLENEIEDLAEGTMTA
jgi:hypothetical protein